MKLTYCKFCGKPLQSFEGESCAECEKYCMIQCLLGKTGAARSWHNGTCVTCEHNPYRKMYTYCNGEWVREPRYEVVGDLQGDEFGMYRKYTVKQWRMQALEWCYLDDDDWEAARIMRTSDDDLLEYMSGYWQIEFKKVDDDILVDSEDVNDYSDETPEEYYEKWFEPQPEGEDFWRF